MSGSRLSEIGALFLAAAALTTGTASVSAQQAVYAAAQADAGATVYGRSCAQCHLTNLQGSFEAPQLAGSNFQLQWGGRPVAELLQFVTERMPPLAGGSLQAEEYAAVVAYILRENGVAPGGAALTASSVGQVLAGAGGAAAAAPAEAPRYPTPGRTGNTTSPFAIQDDPVAAEVTETDIGITRTFRAVEQYTPVTDQDLNSPPDGEWLNWRRTQDGWGYSPLDQVNAENVSET